MKINITVKTDSISTTFVDKVSFGITEDISTTLDIICKRYNLDCVSATISCKEGKFFKRNRG